MYIVGVDPGPIAGVAIIGVSRYLQPFRIDLAEALQVSAGLLIKTLEALRRDGLFCAPAALAYERFVIGPRAARSATPSGGAAARNLIGELEAWATPYLSRFARSAAEVKPWASDTRLGAAGLLEPTSGMRHARDAAQHALFCAVHDYGLPDPFSPRARGHTAGAR